MNKEERNIKCWGCYGTGQASNCPRVNQEYPHHASVIESKKVCSHRKESEDGNINSPSRRRCPENKERFQFNIGSHDSRSLSNCTPIKGETSILQFARDCEILAIDKTRTTALHPQSDGMVERFNRTILNSLFLLVSSNQQDWYKKLPFFLLAYRSAIHEDHQLSPISDDLRMITSSACRSSVQPATRCTLGALGVYQETPGTDGGNASSG
ncbi:retrovirus-related Pol polyprotein from transposon 412 [Trichonephila clavipes]|nr:retrovirus-related Pol polyprotein from transposon 412 [Trichonephila clavipes]